MCYGAQIAGQGLRARSWSNRTAAPLPVPRDHGSMWGMACAGWSQTSRTGATSCHLPVARSARTTHTRPVLRAQQRCWRCQSRRGAPLRAPMVSLTCSHRCPPPAETSTGCTRPRLAHITTCTRLTEKPAATRTQSVVATTAARQAADASCKPAVWVRTVLGRLAAALCTPGQAGGIDLQAGWSRACRPRRNLWSPLWSGSNEDGRAPILSGGVVRAASLRCR